MHVAATSFVSVAGVSSRPIAIRTAVSAMAPSAPIRSCPPRLRSGSSSRTAAVARGSVTTASTITWSHVPTAGPCGASRSKIARPASAPPSRAGFTPRRSTWSMSVGRKVLVPVAEHLERLPERLLGVRLVERLVDVWGDQELDGGREPLQLAGPAIDRFRKREGKAAQEVHRVCAHRHHDGGLHDLQLARQPGARMDEVVLVRLDVALQADGSVELQRVDAQPLEALQHGLAGAAEEGDAFADLRRPRPVLHHHDVRERVAGADHRRDGGMVLAHPLRDLVAQGVGLLDRTGLVLLVDLVVGGAHPCSIPRINRVFLPPADYPGTSLPSTGRVSRSSAPAAST